MPGFALTHVQDLAHGFVELHGVHMEPPLKVSRSIWMAFLHYINDTIHLSVIKDEMTDLCHT